MSTTPLRYLSEEKLTELRAHIPENRDRYSDGNFLDLERENGWAIESTLVYVDFDLLSRLDGSERSATADAANAKIVYRALVGMTPALAREERVWARLTHVECLPYARARWLSRSTGPSLDKDVATHVFAQGRTGVRDDNAVSRLWWSMYIATLADPDDPEGALDLISRKADFRTSIVERTNTVSRRPLARAVLRAMKTYPSVTATEQSLRDFMQQLNRDGGGVLFEAMSEEEIDLQIAEYGRRAGLVI